MTGAGGRVTARDAALVLDAGTSALRASLVDVRGAVTPVGARPWPMFTPDDAAPFGREFGAAGVLEAFTSLREAAAPHRARIAAVACVGQREGIVLADEAGDAVLISPNIDARASAEGMAIDARSGAEVHAMTGHTPSLLLAPAKLAWLRAQRPADAARVRRVVPLADWIAARVAGAPAEAMSASLAAEVGVIDVRTRDVAAPLLATLGLGAALLPRLVPDGTVAGHAPWLDGAPVALAGADTQCALLGMGAVRPGDAGVVAGWSAPVQRVTAAPVADAARRTWTGLHVAPDLWVAESNAGSLGRAWQWMCDVFGIAAAEGDALAAQSPPGARDAMAVLGPRAMNAAAMNAGVGAVTFPLPLVMSPPDRPDLLRATQEAIAFAVRANVEQIEGVTGSAVERIALGGGMSRSALFARILCDALGRAVDVACAPETTAVGAAALALTAAGVHHSLDAAVASMSAQSRTLHPEPATSAAYDDCYERWCAMTDTFESGMR